MLRTLLIAAVVIFAAIYFLSLPVVEVEKVRRGTAISAVYGTVRIEPAFVIRIRAQNTGFIQLADSLSAGRGAIGKTLKKGELLATIADETTARQFKQARADLEAAKGTRRTRRCHPPNRSRSRKRTKQRLEKLAALSNIPAVEYEKAKSEANRLRDAARRRKKSSASATWNR